MSLKSWVSMEIRRKICCQQCIHGHIRSSRFLQNGIRTNEGYYSQVQTSKGPQIWPTMKYYNTMESKLHIFDTNGLRNYRLVHESNINPYTSGGNEEIAYKSIYNVLKRDNSLPAEGSGYAKIFEYVKGARISGIAPKDTTVILTNTIKTNIGRTIQYKQETTSNGTYEFIVPYSTLARFQARPGSTPNLQVLIQ